MVDYKANAIAYLDDWLGIVEHALTEEMRKNFKLEGAKLVRAFWEIGLLTEKDFFKYFNQFSQAQVIPKTIDGSRQVGLQLSQEDWDRLMPDDEDESES